MKHTVKMVILLALLTRGVPAAARQNDAMVADATVRLRIAEIQLENAERETAQAEADAEKAHRLRERYRTLFAHGVIARQQLEKAESDAEQAQRHLAAWQEILALAREVVERAREYLATARAADTKSFTATARPLITRAGRSSARGFWTTEDFSALLREFREHFHTDLPISAYGQTPTHDRLGLDHQGRVDVALHPDSEAGQWLIRYLSHRGIPFIAFSGQVPQSATGAHIHIGPPSARK